MTGLWIFGGVFFGLWITIILIGYSIKAETIRSVLYGFLISFIGTLAGAIIIFANSEQATGVATGSTTNKSNAEMLAVLDGSGNVARYESLLQQLSVAFRVDEKTIADQTAGTVQTLKESGIDESFINIMEGINSISAPIKGSYLDTMTAYAALRIRGTNHRDTILGIEAMWIQLMKVKKMSIEQWAAPYGAQGAPSGEP